jgi:hypothetical protein
LTKHKTTTNTYYNKTKKKDPELEGLGTRILIENMETIAGYIDGAALTGGAAVAGEALLMKGTAGLLNAGRAIIGGSVGAGIKAGASTALGHSDAANIASGIIGGILEEMLGEYYKTEVLDIKLK